MTFILIDINLLGQCGYEDTEHRGDGPDEMGDYLDTVQFPTDFVPIKIVAGWDFNCVLGSDHSSNSSNHFSSSIVCWGQYVYLYLYS